MSCAKPTVALLGNIANNAWNMTCELRGQGYAATLFLDDNDRFAFSQPAWESVPLRLGYADVMQQKQGLDYWTRLARERLPDDGRFRALGNGRKEANAPHYAWLEERIAALCADWPEASRRFLAGVARGYACIIREAAACDVMLAFGLNAAVSAYLAAVPTIYFTYGGDIRVVLANPGHADDTAADVLRRILASPKVVIEAYGCDAQIHAVLREQGLACKSRYAFLPNINRALFAAPRDRREAREELKLPQEAFLVFLPSRVNYRWKGSDRFLAAYADVCPALPDMRLVVAGWGDDYEDALARLEARGVRAQVLCMDGAVSKPLLHAYLSAADLVVDQFVVGSLGSVSFEALCLGRPVLTHLENFNRFGYPSCPPILQAHAREEIAAALRHAHADREGLAGRGRAGREWYAAVYHEGRLAASVDLVAGRGPAAWLALAEEQQTAMADKVFPVPGTASSFRVLRWPAPCKAGLSIANDCEFFDWEQFCALHRWLNNPGEDTPFGPGLGLPVSNSLWFYNENPEGISYFQGTDPARKSGRAGQLEHLLRLGILDALHAYGGFDVRGGFSREHAVAALEELRRMDVRLDVWTNHGNANNHQNIGGLWSNPYQEGDLPGSVRYHADLLAAAGVRFYWLDSFCTNKFSLTTRDGHAFADDLVCDDPADVWGNRLLVRDTLRDGRQVWCFRRFRGLRPLAPDVLSLGRQFSQANLDHLERDGGGIVVYQHMGCTRTASGAARPCPVAAFPREAVAGLSRLAARHHAGRIWVAPLARFLAYAAMLEDLRTGTEIADGGVRLVLSGARTDLRPDDYRGLSIRVSGPDRVAEVVCADAAGVRTPLAHAVVARDAAGETLMVPLTPFPRFPF